MDQKTQPTLKQSINEQNYVGLLNTGSKKTLPKNKKKPPKKKTKQKRLNLLHE